MVYMGFILLHLKKSVKNGVFTYIEHIIHVFKNKEHIIHVFT